MRVSASRPSRSTSTPSETLSTESRLTAHRRGTGPRAARASPRSATNESSSCTAPPTRVAAAGPRHHATGPRLGAARSPRARTTTHRREPAGSRRGSGLTKRREVTPLVRLRKRPAIVCGVRRIHLRGAVASDERLKRLIDQRGIPNARPHAPRVLQQLRIDSGAQSCASHATSMPRECQALALSAARATSPWPRRARRARRSRRGGERSVGWPSAREAGEQPRAERKPTAGLEPATPSLRGAAWRLRTVRSAPTRSGECG
jgi:hypothetical protein